MKKEKLYARSKREIYRRQLEGKITVKQKYVKCSELKDACEKQNTLLVRRHLNSKTGSYAQKRRKIDI